MAPHVSRYDPEISNKKYISGFLSSANISVTTSSTIAAYVVNQVPEKNILLTLLLLASITKRVTLFSFLHHSGRALAPLSDRPIVKPS